MNELQQSHGMDSAIMLARTLATGRGANPAMIERNVQKYQTDEPADCVGRRGHALWQGMNAMQPVNRAGFMGCGEDY